MKKFLLYILAFIAAIIIGIVLFIQFTWDKVYEAPYPDIKASSDSSIIARGRYLVYGPAHCATCHVPMNQVRFVDEGAEIPLSGGWELSIPPGTFRGSNLTPDMETGIGRLSDSEIARTLRYSVGSDGRLIAPFMPFHEISEEDMIAIISFLRSQPAVKNKVEATEFTFLGKAVIAFGLIKPIKPINPIPQSVEKDTSAEYGKYLAYSVANCVGCHTDRDLKTGEHIGEYFAGGHFFEADTFSEGYSYISPNLTPDKETGVMVNWGEELFLARFKTGRVHRGSPMPWGAFTKIDDDDLKALYHFLQSLKPVKNSIPKTVFAPGEKLPQ